MKLTNKFAFYVPSTKEGSTKLTNKEFQERTSEVTKVFCQLFGGASIEQVQGAYTMENGEVVSETINKVISYCTLEQKAEFLETVRQLAQEKRAEYSQESIGLEIDNELELFFNE